MSGLDILGLLVFLGVTLAVGAGAVWLTARLLGQGPARASSGVIRQANADILRSYRFREGYLLSDIARDDAFLEENIDRVAAYRRLTAGLSDISPSFAEHLEALRTTGAAFIVAGRIGGDPVSISGRLEDGDVLVISIGPGDASRGREVVESAALDALRADLSDMRHVMDISIAPMWREDAQHNLIWANSAYIDLAERVSDGEAPSWPLPRLFASDLDPAPGDGTLRRCMLEVPGHEKASWFEIACSHMADGSDVFTAHPVDRLVRAETGLRDFMQTLTKTFAALPIGLAVFDKRRQLVTFNPSFVSLAGIGADVLTSRPDLRSVLDRLRDNKRMPEPRDYRSWREEINRLEEGAANGTYHEIWELPDNKAFRVIGRPHPDGAIAFMFEDISAEVSLTRQFRADLDLLQAVLDSAPAAIAIFDAEGAMVGVNKGYAQMWGPAAPEGEALPNLTRCSALWAARCKPSGVWGDLRQFVLHDTERAEWVEEIDALDGTGLALRMVPTNSRHTVVQFFPREGAWLDPLADLAGGIAGPADTPLPEPEPQPEPVAAQSA